MARLRSALVALAAVTLLTGATTAGTATAANSPREPGCAKLGAYGGGRAEIHNVCRRTIHATVEVDGFDPHCIRIRPGGVGRVPLEPDDAPYYAYEC
ncbi:hypothetical protein [Streptomyces chartreusis]|uniref:hypothetical protein n=1 Tax=Streptomyces chartreusis TaxID=1969 RepID=UPI0037F81BDF